MRDLLKILRKQRKIESRPFDVYFSYAMTNLTEVRRNKLYNLVDFCAKKLIKQGLNVFVPHRIEQLVWNEKPTSVEVRNFDLDCLAESKVMVLVHVGSGSYGVGVEAEKCCSLEIPILIFSAKASGHQISPMLLGNPMVVDSSTFLSDVDLFDQINLKIEKYIKEEIS